MSATAGTAAELSHVRLDVLIEKIASEMGEKLRDKARKQLADFIAEVTEREWVTPVDVEGVLLYQTAAVPFIGMAYGLFQFGATFNFLESFFAEPMAVFASLATTHSLFAELAKEEDPDA